MQCEHCHHINQPDNHFCTNCGQPLPSQAPSSISPNTVAETTTNPTQNDEQTVKIVNLILMPITGIAFFISFLFKCMVGNRAAH